MAWQPVSYWSPRCDGQTTAGQCTALMYDHTPCSFAIDKHGDVVATPFLMDRPNLPLQADAVEACGWLLTRDERLLCPDHVRALEKEAQAAMDGLPFEEVSQ